MVDPVDPVDPVVPEISESFKDKINRQVVAKVKESMESGKWRMDGLTLKASIEIPEFTVDLDGDGIWSVRVFVEDGKIHLEINIIESADEAFNAIKN